MYMYLIGLSLTASASASCLPPLRNYDFKGVGPSSTTQFDLKWEYESAKNYFMSHYNALKAAAEELNADMSTAMAAVGTNKNITNATITASQNLWTSCSLTALPKACEEMVTMTYVCDLPTIVCGDTVTATYADPNQYSVSVEGNTWYIKYSNGHVLATGSVGTPASVITPVNQPCVEDSLCDTAVDIILAENILPTSDSNLVVADTFVLDIDDSKDYFHSHYAALKATANSTGPLPEAFGNLGLPTDQVLAAQMIYTACGTDIECEKTVVHTASCMGVTVNCSDGEKWFYNDGDQYTVDTTEDAWTVRYGDKVLATAPIGQGTMSITPITQAGANTVPVSLATPFEPLYLGAYKLSTMTCEFGTPVSTCTDGVLHLSGCYSTHAEECEDTPAPADYIDKQCCQCA